MCYSYGCTSLPVATAVFFLLQGFNNVQTASGSSCVANGASTEGRNSDGSGSGGGGGSSGGGGSGGPTAAPSLAPTPVGSGCQVANCAACRGAPTNCYLCNSVRP